MQRIVLGIIALSAAFFILAPVKTEASHSWGGYHWARTANPVTIDLGKNLSSMWLSYFDKASTDWNTASEFGITQVLLTNPVAGNTNNIKGKNTPKTCTPTPGRGEVCNAKYGRTGWLGIASIWVSGVHITQGTVKLNDTYFATGSYNSPSWKQMVMCQEIGHIFGLDHQDEDFNNDPLGTCMDYTSNPSRSIDQEPNRHDFEQLASMYAHLDALSTIILSPATAGQNIDHEDRRTWGKELRTSENKRHSVFERDFGNGNKAFTFVTWAE